MPKLNICIWESFSRLFPVVGWILRCSRDSLAPNKQEREKYLLNKDDCSVLEWAFRFSYCCCCCCYWVCLLILFCFWCAAAVAKKTQLLYDCCCYCCCCCCNVVVYDDVAFNCWYYASSTAAVIECHFYFLKEFFIKKIFVSSVTTLFWIYGYVLNNSTIA